MKLGRSATIPKLPRAILRQLVKRFEDSHKTGATFTDHANWLTEKGHPVARSLVHKFCQQLRELKASNPEGTDVLALYLDKLERSKICL